MLRNLLRSSCPCASSMSSSSLISGTVGRDKPTHTVEQKRGKGQRGYVPSEIGAAFRGVFTGVGAVSEDGVPLPAPIAIEPLFSSDIVFNEAY